MKNAKYSFFLGGQLVNNPLDWQEIQILSTFDNDSIQNNVSTSEIKFPLAAARQIKQWVADGLTTGVGIFEGIPFDIIVSNGSDSTTAGNYILDFDTYQETEDRKVSISFRYRDGLNQIADRLEAITFGWLESEGKINSGDYIQINYVEQEKTDLIKLITTQFMILLMAKALADSVEETANAISNIATKGPIGAVIYSIAIALILAAKTTVLLLAFSSMFVNFINGLTPLPRRRRAMTYRRMAEIMCEYLGYTLETNLPLENYVYLPSNRLLDPTNTNGFAIFSGGPRTGIPQSGDYGYALSEFADLIKKLFNAKFAVIGNTLHFRNISDDFWVKQATYQMPSNTFIDVTELNNRELKANKLYKFSTDVTDTWTITDFKGTNFEVITRPATVFVQKNVLLKGLETINFNVCLGSLKTKLTVFDRLLLSIAKTMDAFSKVFGGNSNYYDKVSQSINNVLRVSDANYSLPKVLYIQNGQVPVNYRDLVSAKKIYQDYYSKESFGGEFKGQKKIYRDIKVPFGYEEWIQVSQNSYLKDYQGKEAKITELKWSVGSDYALISFWVKEPYTFNLIEDYIEAE